MPNTSHHKKILQQNEIIFRVSSTWVFTFGKVWHPFLRNWRIIQHFAVEICNFWVLGTLPAIIILGNILSLQWNLCIMDQPSFGNVQTKWKNSSVESKINSKFVLATISELQRSAEMWKFCDYWSRKWTFLES